MEPNFCPDLKYNMSLDLEKENLTFIEKLLLVPIIYKSQQHK